MGIIKKYINFWKNGFKSVGNAADNFFNNTAQINATKEINQQNIDFARESYAKQRADALTDVATANKYNSPIQQMQRMKEAGLNPNMMYGGGSGNVAQSVSTRPSSAPTPQLSVPQMGNPLGKFMDAFIGITTAVARTNNLLAAAENNRTRSDLNIADLNTRDELNRSKIWSLDTGSQGRAIDNGFKQTLGEQQVRLNLQRIINAQADGRLKDQMLKNLESSNDIMMLDYYLKRHGLDGSDYLYIKAAIKFLTTGVLQDAINFLGK